MAAKAPRALFFFSTETGRCGFSSGKPTEIPVIAHSDPAHDGRLMIDRLRSQWPEFCASIFAPWDIRWFFDEHDFHKHGGSFLYNHVLLVMQKENEKLLVKFCQEWSECNKSQFHYLKYLNIDQLFHEKEFQRYGRGFLENALLYMRCAYDRALAAEQNPATSHREEATASRGSQQVRTLDALPQSRAKQYPPHRRRKSFRGSSDPIESHPWREDRRSTSFVQRRTSNYFSPGPFTHPHNVSPTQNMCHYDGPPPPLFPHFGPQVPFPPPSGPIPYPDLPILMPSGEGHRMEPYMMPVARQFHEVLPPSQPFGHASSFEIPSVSSVQHLPERQARLTDYQTTTYQSSIRKESLDQPNKQRQHKGKSAKPAVLRRPSGSSHNATHESGRRDSNSDHTGPWKSRIRRMTSEMKVEQERSLPAPAERLESQSLKSRDAASPSKWSEGATEANRDRTVSKAPNHSRGDFEHPLSLSVGPRHIGENVHDVFEVIIKNAGDATESDIYEFFSSIVPVISVTRPKQWITVRFGSTADVREVLKACKYRDTIVPEIHRCEWTSPAHSPSTSHRGHRKESLDQENLSPLDTTSGSVVVPAESEPYKNKQGFDTAPASHAETNASVPNAQRAQDALISFTIDEQELNPGIQTCENEPSLTVSVALPVSDTQNEEKEPHAIPLDQTSGGVLSPTSLVKVSPVRDFTHAGPEKFLAIDKEDGGKAQELTIQRREEQDSESLQITQVSGEDIAPTASAGQQSPASPTERDVNAAVSRESVDLPPDSSNDFKEVLARPSGKKKKTGKRHKASEIAPRSSIVTAKLGPDRLSSAKSFPSTGPVSISPSVAQSKSNPQYSDDISIPAGRFSQSDEVGSGSPSKDDQNLTSRVTSDASIKDDPDGPSPSTDGKSGETAPISQRGDQACTAEKSTVRSGSGRVEDEARTTSPEGRGGEAATEFTAAITSPMDSDFLARHDFKEWRSTYEQLMRRLSTVKHEEKSDWIRVAEQLKEQLLLYETHTRKDDSKLGLTAASSMRKRLNKKAKDREKSQHDFVDKLTLHSEGLHSRLEKIEIDKAKDKPAYPRLNSVETTTHMWEDKPKFFVIKAPEAHPGKSDAGDERDVQCQSMTGSRTGGELECPADLKALEHEGSQGSGSRHTSETLGRERDETTVGLDVPGMISTKEQSGETHGAYNSALEHVFRITYDGASSAVEDERKNTLAFPQGQMESVREETPSARSTSSGDQLCSRKAASAGSQTSGHSMSPFEQALSEDTSGIAIHTPVSTVSDSGFERVIAEDSSKTEGSEVNNATPTGERQPTARMPIAQVASSRMQGQELFRQAAQDRNSENTRPVSTPKTAAVLINTPKPMSYARAVTSNTAEALSTSKAFVRSRTESPSAQPGQWTSEPRLESSQASNPRGRRLSMTMHEAQEKIYNKGKQPQKSPQSSERWDGSSSSDWSVGPEGQWQPAGTRASRPPSSFKDPIGPVDLSRRRKGG